ncbi:MULTISPECIES: AraC family transcriptional regulator [Streptomyces]|uniref:HTH-type transcriptional regulator RipA n=1 Tax=Streptomyces nigrescens TaxID=1920 RepID=A0A640TET2_STRNI|nr:MULTISPECIES: helix-turn-helix transcriptional regulator [Streptomyces]WAT95742.1 helix-turn-helix transcriptional regulator [Streptomyces libani subsp. libani]WDT58637.1 helix-turn-helix transcriptional regulator [Streptomyces sp. G7(2002)]GFE21011.1 AraC family transcriptional regulator [Streptomyces libani subsp. libani]GGV88718.1 AraC family transcriptional regulator [Streptomyces libani subsp. libani]
MPKSRHAPRMTTGLRPLPAGTGVDAHRHDEHQIVYAGRGVLSVTTEAGSWIAPATRAVWIPAGTVHEHHAHGDTDLHLVALPVRDNPLRLDRPAVLKVGPLLRELILAYTERPADRGAERRRLRAVLLDQLRHSAEQPLHVPAATDPRLVAVCALLRDDPADNRTLAQLGATAGVSDRTLTRLCRAEFGMSFPQWRTQLRLHHALRLLAEETPVTVVAHRCGWASSSAFIDVFRRAFGHTPGAHRAQR